MESIWDDFLNLIRSCQHPCSLSDQHLIGVVDDLPIGWRPVYENRLADHILKRQEVPLMRIARIVAVIAKHEQITFGNRPLTEIKRVLGDIRFLQSGAIDGDDAVADMNGIARQTDDAFYKILCFV